MKIFNLILILLFSVIINFLSFSIYSKEINISGNKSIDTEVIKLIIDQYTNEINQNNINEIIKILKETEGIKDVEINIIGDQINIIIEENQKILNIFLKGNERFKRSEILEMYDFENELLFYNENKIDKFVNEVEQMYLSLGYNQISITYNKKIIKDKNFIDLEIIFDEGKISKINKIYFVGNENFDNVSLRKIIKSRQKTLLNFYSNSNFKLYESNNDIIRINDFYKSRGFKDIDVTLKTEYIANKNKFNLYFYISEGQKYLFDKIELKFEIEETDKYTFNDVQLILDEYLKNKIKSDYTYNYDYVIEIKEEISSFLFSKGEMFFEIRTLEKIDENKVNIIFNLKSVKPNYINKINIYGNTRTQDQVIRREMEFAEGDPVNSFLIQKSYKNIERLNFFKSIDISEKQIKENQIDIDVLIEEQPTGDFKIGAAFGTLDGATFITGLNERNIGGLGRNLQLEVNTSDKNTIYKVNVVEPYIFNKKLNFIYGTNYSNKDRSTSASYKLNKFEIKTGLNYLINDDLFHSFIVKYNLKDYEITDSTKASQSIIDSDGANAEWSINNKFTYDKLNSFFRPTKGNYYSLTTIYSPITNSSDGYLKNTITHKKYIEITKNNVLSFQTRLGNISSLQNNVISTDDKFSLGGRWLRGFDSLGAGPRDSYSSYVGGNNILVSKIDLSRPLNRFSDNPIDLNLFTDVGKVWSNKNTPNNSSESIRASYGAGIKFYSPIGPIGFSWAFPLAEESYDNKRMFLFTIGDLN